uniref:Uncharacterized protein n=1 Tax=Cacopsylla melanoneura TaxID=428564 RepID=A0A8D8W8K5_9HEMI
MYVSLFVFLHNYLCSFVVIFLAFVFLSPSSSICFSQYYILIIVKTLCLHTVCLVVFLVYFFLFGLCLLIFIFVYLFSHSHLCMKVRKRNIFPSLFVFSFF